MYNLAVFNSRGYSIPSSIKLSGFYYHDEKQLLNQLDIAHGVVIHCSAEENQNKVLELILSIKRRFTLPIWIRTETDKVVSKQLNLELGVLGNLDETISNEEMFVIIENTLKLIHNSENDNNVETKINSEIKLQLNSLNGSIKIPSSSEVILTRMEYRMISFLATRMNQAFAYEEIFKHVWKEDDTDNSSKRYRTSNLAFHIRNKLSENGINPRILRTVRSVGYLLDSNMERDELKEVMEFTS
ncbi:DNA-binding response regulator [Enterococcus sp. 5H]|uniref:DNA-binding response regulator n=1 Tax=Enterococcus sp. 5H TaxID=1229490 RepID=UPI0023023E1C|nr:winged helix-turn-helix domain-containing protein [Enterococcus sp. 5H]MDA9472812.1 transcriptional regulator [Enterococcus sp. 5H]